MTETERAQLIQLCGALEELAVGCAHMAGIETVSKVLTACQLLQIALKNNAQEPS